MAHLRSEAALEQVANGATLPGIVRASLAMPDIHQGYGLPVGGVVATDLERGVVSPGAIGFDINCGVRLVRTALDADAITPRLRDLVNGLYTAVPLGVGGKGTVSLSVAELRGVMEDGACWAVRRGHGRAEDLDRLESNGRLDGAAPDRVSPQAVERGIRQLGSLGSGNHFMEVEVVDETYDAPTAKRLGLARGRVTLMIHTGSRGVGHQICTDFLRLTGEALRRYSIEVPDRQLACAPVESPEARAYLGAMHAAANSAFANRQLLTDVARRVFERVLDRPPADLGMDVVYDVAQHRGGGGARRGWASPAPARTPEGARPCVSGPAGAGAGRHGTVLVRAGRDRKRRCARRSGRPATAPDGC